MEIRDKWLAALRSGDYKKGSLRLRDTSDKFCALGVLCDVVDPDGWALSTTLPYPWYFFGNGIDSFLPEDVVELVGLRSQNGHSIDRMNDLSCISAMSDRKSMTFAKIADIIEANPDQFFVK